MLSEMHVEEIALYEAAAIVLRDGPVSLTPPARRQPFRVVSLAAPGMAEGDVVARGQGLGDIAIAIHREERLLDVPLLRGDRPASAELGLVLLPRGTLTWRDDEEPRIDSRPADARPTVRTLNVLVV